VVLAVRQLEQYGGIARKPIRQYVAATSVGIVAGAPVLDLNYDEDSSASVDMNVVMTGAGEFVEIQATGEKTTYNEEQLGKMLSLARAGVGELIEIQKRVISAA
jgi:ribonuclease PH